MKPDDTLPGKRNGSADADDGDALSRLHRRVSDDELPPQVEMAVLAAARRLAHPDVPPVEDDSESDAWLARVHRDFSPEQSPAEVDARVLSAAGHLAQSRLAPPTPLQARARPRRLRVSLALAASVVVSLLAVQMLPHAPERERIEMLGTQPDRDAEQWLAEIRKLIDQGREVEAAQRLAAFRKRYPGLPVPDDIRGKLDKAPER